MDAPEQPPPKRRSSAMQRHRGRKGGRPRKQVVIPDERRPGGQASGAGHPPPDPNDPRWARFCQAYRWGIGLDDAARVADLAPTTVERWRTWAGEGKEPYASMWGKALSAESVSVETVASHVAADRGLDWLARVRPERWRDPAKRMEVSGPDGGPVNIVRIVEDERAKERREGEPPDDDDEDDEP